MKSKVFFKLIIFLFMILSVPSYSAENITAQEASDFVEQTGYRLIEALGNRNLDAKYDVLDELFYEKVDTDYLARFVMGKYWRQMTEKQKKDYLELFPRYVVSVYKRYPLDFGTEGLNLEILSSQPNGMYADVVCRVILPQSMQSDTFKDIPLEFKVSKETGQLKIVDLKITQSSLLVSYRNRFYQMIAGVDEDIDWFLEDFAALTASAEKSIHDR